MIARYASSKIEAVAHTVTMTVASVCVGPNEVGPKIVRCDHIICQCIFCRLGLEIRGHIL